MSLYHLQKFLYELNRDEALQVSITFRNSSTNLIVTRRCRTSVVTILQISSMATT